MIYDTFYHVNFLGTCVYILKIKNMSSTDKCTDSLIKTTAETPITAFVKSIFQQASAQQKEPQLPFLQTTQKILDEIIKFHSYVQSTNHTKFWDIDSNTFDLELDDFNSYIAKCTLHQANLFTAI